MPPEPNYEVFGANYEENGEYYEVFGANYEENGEYYEVFGDEL